MRQTERLANEFLASVPCHVWDGRDTARADLHPAISEIWGNGEDA